MYCYDLLRKKIIKKKKNEPRNHGRYYLEPCRNVTSLVGFNWQQNSMNLNELSEDVHGQIEFPAEVILYLIR